MPLTAIDDGQKRQFKILARFIGPRPQHRGMWRGEMHGGSGMRSGGNFHGVL